jgi:hypothetical protein
VSSGDDHDSGEHDLSNHQPVEETQANESNDGNFAEGIL